MHLSGSVSAIYPNRACLTRLHALGRPLWRARLSRQRLEHSCSAATAAGWACMASQTTIQPSLPAMCQFPCPESSAMVSPLSSSTNYSMLLGRRFVLLFSNGVRLQGSSSSKFWRLLGLQVNLYVMHPHKQRKHCVNLSEIANAGHPVNNTTLEGLTSRQSQSFNGMPHVSDLACILHSPPDAAGKQNSPVCKNRS